VIGLWIVVKNKSPFTRYNHLHDTTGYQTGLTTDCIV